MAKETDDDTPSGNENIRRVYALPAEMVDRITQFQQEKGLNSEVEAVRRLLDEALKSRDDMTKIINRFLSRLGRTRSTADAARDVLVGHPKVHSITFDGDDVIFWLKETDARKDKEGAAISDNGSVRLLGFLQDDSWSEGNDGPFSPGSILTNEIPF